METAGPRFRDRRRPRGRDGRGVLRKHIDEVVGHDEWLLGVSRRSVAIGRRSPPTTVTHCRRRHWRPVLLDPPLPPRRAARLHDAARGCAPAPADVEDLMARTGYGPDSFRTMSGQPSLDPATPTSSRRRSTALPLRAEQSAVLGFSAMSTVHGLAHALDELVDERTPSRRGTASLRSSSVSRSSVGTARPARGTARAPRCAADGSILEDHPLGAGDPLVDLTNDVRGRLVVPTRDEQRRRRDLMEPIGDVPPRQRPDDMELARPVHRVVDGRLGFDLIGLRCNQSGHGTPAEVAVVGTP